MGNPPVYGYDQYPAGRDNPPIRREELVNIINEIMNQIPHRRMSRLVYRKQCLTWIDQLVEMLRGYIVPEFTLFSGENDQLTIEHIGRFMMRCGEASSNDLFKLKLFGNSLTGTAFAWYINLPADSNCSW